MFETRKGLGRQAGDLAGDDGLHDLSGAAVGARHRAYRPGMTETRNIRQSRSGQPQAGAGRPLGSRPNRYGRLP